MNREERRKVNKNKNYRKVRRNVLNIGTILDITKSIAEEADKNITSVVVPENVEKVLHESAEIMESSYNVIPMIKGMFLQDEDVKKCVVNALEIPTHRQKVCELVKKAVQNQANGAQGSFDYMVLHDLSADRIEVTKTLKTLEEALPVMINGLKANDIETIKELQVLLTVLERRIYHLYCLYGYYLNDIGKIDEYNEMYQFFTLFDCAFRMLTCIDRV